MLMLSGTACSHGSSSSAQLTPDQVNRYVQVKGATASLTRLAYLISAADSTVQELSHQSPHSRTFRQLVYGARLGWNNVVVQLNDFTQAQAVVVPELTTTVGLHKTLATTWLNELDALRMHPPKSRQALLRSLSGPQKQELKNRYLLSDTAAALAKVTCALQLKYPVLATPADAATSCGTAKQLAANPAT